MGPDYFFRRAVQLMRLEILHLAFHDQLCASVFFAVLLTQLLAFPPTASAAIASRTPYHAFAHVTFTTSTSDKYGQQTRAFIENSRHRQISLKYKNHDDSCASRVLAVAKHPLFRQKNVHLEHFHIDTPNIWECALPQVDILASMLGIGGGQQLRRGVIGKDVTVEFDEARDGAKMLLEGCGLNKDTDELVGAMDHLTRVLSFYQEIVSYGQGGKHLKCKARIVSTRGQIGVKCPRWHADHVPVRLVMSLIGPGCDFIPEKLEAGNATEHSVHINREALNSLDMEDTAAANRIIVPDRKGVIHASAGDAVLLMGRDWEDVGIGEKAVLHAAVHKSPVLDPFEGRVLLVVDVVPQY